MKGRRIVVGIVGITVVAAVIVGVMSLSAPSDGISVRLHCFTTNGHNLQATVAISNTTSKDFLVSISTECMTNGAFPQVPAWDPPNHPWEGESHGLLYFVDVVRGSRSRFVAQYRCVPSTCIGRMLEPIRTTLVGPRPILHSYSEEFETPP